MSPSWLIKTHDYLCRHFLLLLALTAVLCHAWLPDSSTKIINAISKTTTIKFDSKSNIPEHFIVLHQDETSILLGGRNSVYNLSVTDFSERKENKLEWSSTEPHVELCLLKGKRVEDCQNYIRILAVTSQNQIFVCGTNSYKPMCRYYNVQNGQYNVENEVQGTAKCPYDPEHNSTAVFSNGQLYSATVADFSGGDPLIYREPQRTELSDLKQLNAPNFVSSLPYGDYIFFFYRETAVEYINCGKVIYSRVARVCKDDKGGPRQFREKWTSFLKARLNCSVPGEYPFYFDEIQSTSDIIEGNYGYNGTNKIIYGTLTTPTNAIGGSAICAYSVNDILAAFDGSFKHQETMNSNWLPIPEDKIPEGKPGRCVQDSRLLSESIVNFVKSHSLMETAVPAFFGKPLLIRVSQEYRFTSIAVDPQVPTVNDGKLDVLYVGTDDGKVLKVVNIASGNTTKTVVISESVILAKKAPVKQLKIVPGYGKVVVVGIEEVRLATLNHCENMKSCNECVSLQDPHCAWDDYNFACETLDETISKRTSLIQDIKFGNPQKCNMPGNRKPFFPNKEIYKNTINDEDHLNINNDVNNDESIKDCGDDESNEIRAGCAIQQAQMDCAKKWQNIGIIASLACLIIGFISGYCMSKKCQHGPQYPNPTPFIEQHNHLDRSTPRATKSVNLNVSQNNPQPKKDNLDISKDLNILDHDTGTLQKIKKTYI
ncbi:semaphorin-1A-like [Onthophagus taurus]|uniref:semaphorin-1A-like n=1 Tax=Onthophagus taurus TaxID=166361 RepID=UPI0039BDC2A2